MKKTSNGIPYDATSGFKQNSVTLFPSKELHKLPAVMAAKKEMRAAGIKVFITWTRMVKTFPSLV